MSLIWNSGLVSKVQLPVASVIVVARTWEEFSDLTQPAYKYEERRRDSYNTSYH